MKVLVKILTLLLVIILALSILANFKLWEKLNIPPVIEETTEIESSTKEFHLENIGELATQAGYFTTVQKIEDYKELFGKQVPFTQSQYIYSYDGIVKAGIDFGKIEITVDDDSHSIVIKMPEPTILDVDVDEKSFEIYDEKNSVFTPLKLDAINDSRIQLEETVKEKAINNGILDSARTNAEVLLSGFMSAYYDLNEYTVKFE